MDNKLQLLLDIQKETARMNFELMKVIKRLIICIVLIVAIFVGAAIYFVNTFEIEETYTETTTTETVDDVDITSSGEGSEATYIGGDQYNDESVHDENSEMGGDE